MQTYGQRLLQAVGDTVLSMISLIIGAVVNIILDPIMIFGLLGCPAMGIRGAAIATVIGQLMDSHFYQMTEHVLREELAAALHETQEDAGKRLAEAVK